MAISKQAIVLKENIHSETPGVSATVGPNQNLISFLVEVVVNSQEEKSNYTEEEMSTMRMIEADDDLNSSEATIYQANIRVISKKISPGQTLLKISFDTKGKIPGSPGS